MCGDEGYMGNSCLLSVQFCYEFKSALKNKVSYTHTHIHTASSTAGNGHAFEDLTLFRK